MSSLKERSESRRQRLVCFLVEEESCQELMNVEIPDRSDETIQDSCRDEASSGITDENRVEISKDPIAKESNKLACVQTPDRSDETMQNSSCRDGASSGITDENRVEISKDPIAKESNKLACVQTPDRSDETMQNSSCRDGASSGITDENRDEISKDSIGNESNEFLPDNESDSEEEYSSYIGDLQYSLEDEAVVLDRRNSTDLEVNPSTLSLKFVCNTPLGALVTGPNKKRGDKYCKDIILADQDPTLDQDPLRASYVRSIPKAQLYKGVLLLGNVVNPSTLMELDDFEVRDDDVFIITYPKSGTTWTEELVSLIYNDGDTTKVKKKMLTDRVRYLEFHRGTDNLQRLRQVKSPRLLATHLPLPLIPKCLRQGKKCKIIYVVRNPKDNAVSYYHYHRMNVLLGNYRGTWSDFLDLYMRGYLVNGSWFDHVLPYWRFHQEHPDIMFFTSFEDLKLDLPGMVSKMACFLDRPLTPEATEAVSNHCSFEQMKNNTMVNMEDTGLFDLTQSRFMRKGVIGDWKNYFTEEQSRAFNKLYNEMMQGSGLELIFEPEEINSRNNMGGRATTIKLNNGPMEI